jgi:small nuclear ribonucleoprotein (snRNP)-like protein
MVNRVQIARVLSCLLISLALAFGQPLGARAQAPASAAAQGNIAKDSRTEKIKAKVTKIGMGKDVTVRLSNGDNYYGSIQSVEDDSFKMYEVDLKRLVEFKYSEVRKVESGYGHSRDLYGRRIPPRKLRIGLAIGLAAIIVPILIVLPALKQ